VLGSDGERATIGKPIKARSSFEGIKICTDKNDREIEGDTRQQACV
jgi:hypothetical protein